MNAVLPLVLVIVLIVALVLWGRGLIRSNQSDMIAGCCIFGVMCILGIFAARSSAIIPFLGGALIIFSIDTLVAGAFGGAACPLKGTSRVILSLGLILLGILFLLVV